MSLHYGHRTGRQSLCWPTQERSTQRRASSRSYSLLEGTRGDHQQVAKADNHSDISSRRADGSSATGCSIALSMENGSRNAAANRRACSPQRRTKAAVNALERLALDCAIPNRHPRKVAQSVVKVGPPRRCTMLSEVDAIGRSCFLTEAYAAEIEGMPTALRPIPRTKRAHASTVSTSP